MTLYSEYNGASTFISPGGPQPVIWISLCAVILKPDGTPVGAGIPVQFDVPEASTWWLLSASSATTNDSGQAVIAVRPLYGAPPATVRARWMQSMMGVIAQASIYIQPETDACQTLNATPQNGWGPLANPQTIRYGWATYFTDVALAAMNVWQATGRVGFARADDQHPTQIFFQDACNNLDPTYAMTILGPSRRDIVFNPPNLDGNPKAPLPECRSNYPPRNARHHLLSTAAHEVGHALGLEHNQFDRAALMYPGIQQFFVCGTSAPTSDELTTIAILYP
jgi:hypothetical protein